MQARDARATAEALVALCIRKRLTVATAESCTGGLVAAAITDIAGSSAVLDRGFVTYSNEAKQQMLGVPSSLIASHGAVSRECAEAMAAGVLQNAAVDLAVSITGIAGPGGGSKDKPVGLVHFAAASRDGRTIDSVRTFGDIGRDKVRQASVLEALSLLMQLAEAAQEGRP